MLNRFKEMVLQGVAPSPYKQNVISNDTTECDYICCTYNNFWGIVNDTHMSVAEDGRRVITGSFISRTFNGSPNCHLFDSFIAGTTWGAVQFPYPFSQIIYNNGLQVKYEVINGAECAVLVPRDPDVDPIEDSNFVC